MIALPKDRPLVDGENEYITIERIAPVMAKRNHLHPDWWTAEGTLDGLKMVLVIMHEDRRMFLDAGYVPAEILTLNPKTVHIDVRTMKDAQNRWRVAEVVSRDESATVYSDDERKADYLADLRAFGGKFTLLGETELQFSTAGRWVNWSTDSEGRYVRLTLTDRKLYAGKGQS